ncbi:MAG: flagellar basal body P-ring formation chaperone FlgA [Myxococcota bacterium]
MTPPVAPELPTAIHASLVAYATARCEATAVEVRWLGVDPARLPAGATPSWSGDPCRPHPLLTATWTVGVDSDRVTVRPDLVVWVHAPVAAHPVEAGAEVEVTDGTAPLSALVAGRFTGDAAIASRALNAGEPLTRLNVRAKAAAVSGAEVTLRVRVGTLVVTADGRLLGDAQVGDVVRVFNHATEAVVSGTLVSPDTVEL